MKNLQVFNYNNNEIRTIEINNETWWVLKDVCEILEIKNPTDIAKRLDEDELTRFNLGGQSGTSNIVNESGLYSVILRSDKPQAKPFRKWVTSEVLPSIRKTGSYSANLSPELQAIFAHDQMLQTIKVDVHDIKQDIQTLPLLAIDCDSIKRAVSRKGVECLGGKESPAYQNKSLSTKIFTDIHRELRRQFDVDTYKGIKRRDIDIAVNVVKSYAPPMVLKNDIAIANDRLAVH